MKDILTTLLEDSNQSYIVDGEFMPDSLVIILAGQ